MQSRSSDRSFKPDLTGASPVAATSFARVAQLAEAPDRESGGWECKSPREYHFGVGVLEDTNSLNSRILTVETIAVK